jgi:hypothetical protein
MRGDPAEREGDPKGSECRMGEKITVEGVKHYRRVDSLEGPCLKQSDLAASPPPRPVFRAE